MEGLKHTTSEREKSITISGVADTEFVKDIVAWKEAALQLLTGLKAELYLPTVSIEFIYVGQLVHLM